MLFCVVLAKVVVKYKRKEGREKFAVATNKSKGTKREAERICGKSIN